MHPRFQGRQSPQRVGPKVADVRLKVAEDTISPVQEPFGPVMCAFYGIAIRFDVGPEAAPMVTAEYRSRMAVIEIEPARVTQSNLLPRGINGPGVDGGS